MYVFIYLCLFERLFYLYMSQELGFKISKVNSNLFCFVHHFIPQHLVNELNRRLGERTAMDDFRRTRMYQC